MASHSAKEGFFMDLESLAYWYLRLNGCLTVRNFVLHPPPGGGGGQRTEADVIAIRSPHRSEFDDDRSDDGLFTAVDKPLFLVAEATRANCKLNEPWKGQKGQESLAYVLRRFGPVEIGEIEALAKGWAREGAYTNSSVTCAFLCFGEISSEELGKCLPQVWQKSWKKC
jgi:hypothetical protein